MRAGGRRGLARPATHAQRLATGPRGRRRMICNGALELATTLTCAAPISAAIGRRMRLADAERVEDEGRAGGTLPRVIARGGTWQIRGFAPTGPLPPPCWRPRPHQRVGWRGTGEERPR